MFDDVLNSILYVLGMGVVSYSAMVFLLRISGKRTLSKWNAFDLIVTVALGSSLSTAFLPDKLTLLQGITGFFLLIFLQFIVTWLSVRFKFLENVFKSRPVYLVRDGKYLIEKMKKERVSESEIRAAVRSRGIGDIKEVKAVVLETDGSFSIIENTSEGPDSTLVDVE